MTPRISDEQIELLQAMAIFGGITAEVLRFLLPLTKRLDLRAGDIVFREGDPASSLFVLEHGEIHLLKLWEDDQYRLKTLRRGDCFGEVSLIDLQPRLTTAIAPVDTTLIQISAANLQQLYEKEPEQFTLIYINMAREVCRRLREAELRGLSGTNEAVKIDELTLTPGPAKPTD